MIALLAPLQMRQQLGPPLGCQRLAPQRGKFLSCFKTIHDCYMLRPATSLRSACLRSACRARNAPIFTFRLTPSKRLGDFADAQSSLSLSTITIPVLGFERVEQAMRQIVCFAPLFGLTDDILRRRDVRRLHPLHFRRAEVPDQFLGPPPPAAQLVVTQVHHYRPQPSAKRHLRPIRRQRGVGPIKLSCAISRAISSSEKNRRHNRSTRGRCRPGKLGKSVVLPAEDFGYQFLVGFGAQSPPCPSTRRATQHNCLLIRTVRQRLQGIRFFAQSMPSGTSPCAYPDRSLASSPIFITMLYPFSTNIRTRN